MITEDPRSIKIPVIRVSQKIGEFYSGTISSQDLVNISDFDVRRITKGEGLETYLGIQRELSKTRVKEIRQYLKGPDATFPTAVVLAVSERCASLTKVCEELNSHFWLTLSNFIDEEDPENSILYRQIARVIDGQHRIEGLRNYDGPNFEINVSVFVGADIPDQATIFSVVNLAQTKVNRSLVYDLFDLAKSRSPEKLAHNVVVALDRTEDSPFYKKIKRLGTATEGRDGETLAQATVVGPLLKYISGNKLQVLKDRQAGLKENKFEPLSEKISKDLVLRPFLLEDRDVDLAELVWNYFEAVSQKWPKAWNGEIDQGMLNRTNGYNALMRFFPIAYKSITEPGNSVSTDSFNDVFKSIEINEQDLTSKKYVPGSSGAKDLFLDLCDGSGLSG